MAQAKTVSLIDAAIQTSAVTERAYAAQQLLETVRELRSDLIDVCGHIDALRRDVDRLFEITGGRRQTISRIT